jgi:bifunctional non-homologous end joining protein LigD
MLRKLEYLPCIPTHGTKIPPGQDWFHEVKHDDYRLIVQREGKRVRPLTYRGYDGSKYPHHPIRVRFGKSDAALTNGNR